MILHFPCDSLLERTNFNKNNLKLTEPENDVSLAKRGMFVKSMIGIIMVVMYFTFEKVFRKVETE